MVTFALLFHSSCDAQRLDKTFSPSLDWLTTNMLTLSSQLKIIFYQENHIKILIGTIANLLSIVRVIINVGQSDDTRCHLAQVLPIINATRSVQETLENMHMLVLRIQLTFKCS